MPKIAQDLITTASDWLKFVEYGGMIIVMMAFGIVLGELATEDLERVSQILAIVSTGCNITLALAVVYFTQVDRRKSRQFLLFGVLASLTMANASSVFSLFQFAVHDIMFSVASVLVVLLLLVGALQGRFQGMIRKGGPDDRNKCGSPPPSNRG